MVVVVVVTVVVVVVVVGVVVVVVVVVIVVVVVVVVGVVVVGGGGWVGVAVVVDKHEVAPSCLSMQPRFDICPDKAFRIGPSQLFVQSL